MRDDTKCSFCGKPNKRVKNLIRGPNSVYICDECVDLCRAIIEETLAGTPAESASSSEGSWRIEVEVTTTDADVRDRIAGDIDSWRRVADGIVARHHDLLTGATRVEAGGAGIGFGE